MELSVRLEQQAGRPLAVVKLQATQRDLPRVVPKACGDVWGAAKAHQVAGLGRLVALYLDGVINLEIGVECDPPIAGFDDLLPSSTPAGEVATVTHFGPYPQLHTAHTAIQDWCRLSGRIPAGPQWEIYGHWQAEWNQDPSLIRTDVCYLLTSSSG